MIPAAPPAAPNQVLRGIFYVCAATLFFIALDTMNKTFVRYLPPIEVAWGRTLAQFVLMTAIFAPRMGMRLVRTRKPWLQFGRGLMVVVSSVCAIGGLRLLPLADAMAMANSQSLMVVILSVPLLGERVGPRRWAAVVAGFIGVLVVAQPGGGGSVVGMTLMLSAALCMALYLIMTRRMGLEENPIASLYLVCVVGTVGLSVALPAVWVTPQHWWIYAGMAASGVCGGIGHYFMMRAFMMAPASTLAPFTYTTLIWATIISWAVFGDTPPLTTVAGMALIAAAGLYTAYRENQARRAA